MKFLLFASLLFVLSACPIYDPPTNELTINNHSDSAIYFYATCKDELDFKSPLKLFWQNEPNTMLDQNGDDMGVFSSPGYRINAYCIQNQFKGVAFSSSGCSECYPNNGLITFFFITESTMRKYSWKEICDGKLYHKKLKFKKKQLDQKDWIVHYYP